MACNPFNSLSDSFTDLITNVLGVVVLTSTLTLVCVADVNQTRSARNRLAQAASAAATAELERQRLDHAEACARLQELRRQWGGLEPLVPALHVDLQAVLDAIAILRAEAERRDATPPAPANDADTPVLGDSLAQRLAAAESAGQRLATRHEELLAIRTDGSELRLPDPDARLAEGRDQVTWILHHGRFFAVDNALVEKTVQSEIKAILDRRDQWDWDDLRTAMVAHFAQKDVGDACCRVRVTKIPGLFRIGQQVLTGGLEFDHVLREKAQGLDRDQCEAPDSLLRRLLSAMDSKKQWIHFVVYDDAESLALYPAVRRLVEAMQFAAGWVPYSEDQHWGGVFGERVGVTRIANVPDGGG